jgi:crotonobetainyl-CoA:carnitine CoA-transferase CaiB-like acyl-CoA transferase
MDPRDVPLAGLRVLDLTRHLPGPLCTLWLAALGAEVVKIEPPEGDPLRALPPLRDGTGLAFLALNRGKRSVVLDARSAEGRERLADLVRQSDILVEGFRPGVLARMGLSIERLRALRSDLVVCRITGYGQSGPYAARPGHDLDYLALAGLAAPWPARGRAAQAPAFQAADVAGGALTATVRILAALRTRDRTGCGADLDVAMCRGAATLGLLTYADALGPEDQHGLLTGAAPLYDVYPTADGGALAVASVEPKFGQAFAQRAGLEGGADKAAVAAAVSARTRAEWEAQTADLAACVEPVLSPREALSHPALWGDDAPADPFEALCALAVPLGQTVPLGPAPALGADTEAVLAQLQAREADAT